VSTPKRGDAQGRSNSAVLPSLVLLALLLVMLPGLVMAQQAPPAKVPAAGQPAPQAPAAVAATPSPVPTLVGVPCDPTPVPGSGDPTPVPMPESAKIVPGVREEEVAVTYKTSDNSGIKRYGFNYVAGNTTLAFLSGANDAVGSSWAASTAVDFNGDRFDEIFTAYKDSNKMLTAVSYVGRPPTSATATTRRWTAGAGAQQGDDVGWIAVTAGNLERRADRRETVVMAFSNADHDLQMIALNGGTDGHIAQANGTKFRNWVDSADGRGTVHHVSVAHGDLNGDGWADEIVTAFSDSGGDLQVLVTRLETGSNTWTKVAQKRYTDGSVSHYANDAPASGDDNSYPERGISVTTGDVNGDGYDEAIVALADHGDNIQVIGLQLSGSSLQEMLPDPDGYFRAHPDTRDPDYVSVAAPDLDGDGKDEIVVAFGGRVDFRPILSDQGPAPVQLWTLKVDCPTGEKCSLKRNAFGITKDQADYDAGIYRAPRYVSVKAANVDLATGEQEVALAFVGVREDATDRVLVKTYRQIYLDMPLLSDPNNKIPILRELADNVIYLSTDGSDSSVVVGDFDGNSVRLKYADQCTRYGVTTLNSVVNLPPMYGGLHVGDVAVAYGQSVAGGATKGESLAGSIGATVELDGSASVLDVFEVGPVLTTEFEYTHSVSKEEGGEAEASTAYDVGYNPENTYSPSAFGFALSEEVKYQTYKYVDESGTLPDPVFVRVPKARGATSKVLEYWNADWYLAGWQPLGYRNNLAQGKPATQSSTANGGVAGRAVDGNTDGNFANNSVTETTAQTNPYWQVNLGSVQSIGSIDIWNRTDGGQTFRDRLKNFVVKLYDSDQTATNWDNPTWTSDKFTQAAEFPTVVRVSRSAQFVRVEIAGAASDPPNTLRVLSLAEVQVWGTREVSAFPKGLTRNSDTQFTLTNQNGTTQVVTGNLKWDWCTGYKDPDTGIPVGAVAGQPELAVSRQGATGTWNMSTAFSGSETQEDSFSVNQSLVYEAKAAGVGVAAGVTWGFEGGMSRSVTWNAGTYFEGTAAGLKDTASDGQKYLYCPYYYTTKKTTADGSDQAYLVLDYYVPCIGSTCSPSAPTAVHTTAAMRPTGTLPTKPAIPLIASPTHPDPDAWSIENTATFTWQQPAGDPAQVTGYRYFIDQQATTIPDERVQGMEQEYTYRNLADGTWYLHVRAKGATEWSDTAHRRIRIDKSAPTVKLTLDPPVPTGNQNWYRTPLTVAVTALDSGSSVGTLEYAIDGGQQPANAPLHYTSAASPTTGGQGWQPYNGPMQFTSDTPPTTLWVRATDVAGHASDPISTTFKVDLTAPDSHVAADCGIWGVCQATITTDAQGNEHLLMSGQINEGMSGRAGMEIQANGGSWTAASALGEWHPFADKPAVTTNWMYSGTLDLGHGFHIFQGRSIDGAGNIETPYQIAAIIWYPLASPDLSQSSLIFEPAIARPGDTVTVSLAVRNGGLQEAHVAISTTLPAGLSPAEGALTSIDGSTTYNPATGVITWPEVLLWPDQAFQIQFQAVVANGLPASTLTSTLAAHAFWPNSNLLNPIQQQQFTDHEATASISSNLTVNPLLPAGRDVTAPHIGLTVAEGEVPGADTVQLVLPADTDARLMYVREWTLNPATGAWTIVRNSGWVSYAPTLTWSLSDGAGVKYFGAWVADSAGNVSHLDENSLAFTNRLIDDNLLAGQRRQYRFTLDDGLAIFNLLTRSGQVNLYAWMPKVGQYPTYVGEGSTLVKALGFPVEQEGVYLVEAAASLDSDYTLMPAYGTGSPSAGAPGPATASGSNGAVLPNHPLALSTPLTGGGGAAPQLVLNYTYMPLIFRSVASN
jgi:hypothetical protein